jgi:hypothetical protein
MRRRGPNLPGNQNLVALPVVRADRATHGVAQLGPDPTDRAARETAVGGTNNALLLAACWCGGRDIGLSSPPGLCFVPAGKFFGAY